MDSRKAHEGTRLPIAMVGKAACRVDASHGAVKIGVIAIERSILAWTYLLDEDKSGASPSMIELLEKITGLLDMRFPLARAFVRPGFDEIEAVM